jgi:hypothetical protein
MSKFFGLQSASSTDNLYRKENYERRQAQKAHKKLRELRNNPRG